jgi:FtsH-binding integral membrane protein
MDNKEAKAKSLFNTERKVVSDNTYNAVIGLTLLWGIVINVLMAFFLTPYIVPLNRSVVIIGYLVVSFACRYVVFKSNNALISILGFTGLAGAMGVLLTYVLKRYTSATIYSAFLSTGIILVVMIILSTLYPAFFRKLGRVLFIALVGSLVVQLVGGLLLHLRLGFMDYILVVIFSGYIGYNWSKAQAYPKTIDNAIDSAASIYIDIINIFIRLLRIIERSKD